MCQGLKKLKIHMLNSDSVEIKANNEVNKHFKKQPMLGRVVLQIKLMEMIDHRCLRSEVAERPRSFPTMHLPPPSGLHVL